jgi:quercetin dioxygenase-like cupin family protein
MKIDNYKNIEPQKLMNGKILKRVLIGPKDNAPTFVMRVFTLEPGASTPYHTHPWEHEVFVLEGKLKVKAKDREYEVEKESFVFVEPNEEHQFINIGDTPASFICVIPNSGGE